MPEKKKILIVDDEKIMVQLLRLEFEHAGYEVFCAFNGDEGLGIVQAGAVDLIISDAMMPGMDGFEFCRRIKNDQEQKMIPFILLSAKGQAPDRERGRQVGADMYVIKPFEAEELLKKVSTLLGV